MLGTGSDFLTRIMHALSQSLLIPVVVGLIFLIIYALMELGHFFGERKARGSKKRINMAEILHDVENHVPWKIRNYQQVADSSIFSVRQKNLIDDLLSKLKFSKDAKELIARDILDHEETRYKKLLNKTDLLAKVGPILGLMGTLIPLGPGLGALGQGDFESLTQAIIIAFDTTVIGMLIGGIGSCISKVRNRWYNQDLNSLELVLELIIGGEEHFAEENETTATARRGS